METIAERVESLREALEWTDESYALGGEVDCGWDDDDTHGWLRMGPVEVDWQCDPYGDGQEDWSPVSDPTYAQSRRAYYEAVGYGEGRIELEYRLGAGEWRAYDERLPEDEADVHAMAREAYEWVKAVAE